MQRAGEQRPVAGTGESKLESASRFSSFGVWVSVAIAMCNGEFIVQQLSFSEQVFRLVTMTSVSVRKIPEQIFLLIFLQEIETNFLQEIQTNFSSKESKEIVLQEIQRNCS